MAAKGLVPCLFAMGLAPGEWIPVRFGGHDDYLVGSIGPIGHDCRIAIRDTWTKSKYLKSQLYRFLSELGYHYVDVYRDIQLVARESGKSFAWKTFGERITNIG